MKTFTMSDDQVDQIIIDELKGALDRNLRIDRDEGGFAIEPDHELIESIKNVLRYFMVPSEIEAYMELVAGRQQDLDIELLHILNGTSN